MANDFKIFAGSGGANVVSQSTYVGNTSLLANGFSTGIADSTYLNKVWRQSSIMASMIAQYIFDRSGLDSIDDGTNETLLERFKAAIIADGAQGTVTSVQASGGTTGLSFSGGPIVSAGTLTLSGTLNFANGGTGLSTLGAPNQVLTTNGAGTALIWADAEVGSGTVTSVQISGGSTGLTVSGGPITSNGTITLAGTVAISAGGTGQTTAEAACTALLPTQAGQSGKFLTTNGTIQSWANVDLDAPNSSTDTGSQNNHNCTLNHPPVGLYRGFRFWFVPGWTNTGHCQLNCGFGSFYIKCGGHHLTNGEIVAGRPHWLSWNDVDSCYNLESVNGTFTCANGTSGEHAVNMSQFPVTTGAQGYYKLPNGVIHQWVTGTSSPGSPNMTVNWPVSFPNGVLQGWSGDAAPSWQSNQAVAWAFDKSNSTAAQCRVVLRNLLNGQVSIPSTGLSTVVHSIGW